MSERSLQVMVEIVIDISERIIAIENVGPVETASKAIDKLVELKVIDSADPYVDMVRFRNLIVHRYEVIDPALLYSIATTKLNDGDSIYRFETLKEKLLFAKDMELYYSFFLAHL